MRGNLPSTHSLGHREHPPNSIILFSYFLTHSSHGLTPCLIFCDWLYAEQMPSLSSLQQPSGLFPQWFEFIEGAAMCARSWECSFPGAQPCVWQWWLSSDHVILLDFSSASFCTGLPPTRDATQSLTASVPPTPHPPLFSRLLINIFRHTVVLQILRAV